MTSTVTGYAAPPTMPGSAIVGSAWDLQRRLLATQERAMREFGDVVRFVAGPPGARMVMYSAFAPDDVQQILTSRTGFRKDNQFYREIRAALGDGLLTSQDEEWTRQKRFLQPLFVRAQLQQYGRMVTDESAALIERWHDTGIVSLHPEMIDFTVRIIGRMLFGADLAEVAPLLRNGLPEITTDVYRRGFAPLNVPQSWPTPRNLRSRRARDRIRSILDARIADRRRNPTENRDMLALLTDPAAAVSDREARDQLLVFLFAGHDTTASALTFTLHLLGSHPDVQRHAADEVRHVLDGRPPTADDVAALPYLGQVLKESLRLYPPAYATSRRTTDERIIGGCLVPSGSDVAVYPWCTHRHPRLWDEPQRFAPDRFTPEREATRHRYAWFPFGGGPRACIGAQVSTVEAIITLATILQHYRLSTPVGPVPVTPRITLHPAAPVPCELVRV